ncbi:MAG: hypothetical protein RLZZ505_537 [Verrucomicrobiota bacterium]|jgi:hypothetical protein
MRSISPDSKKTAVIKLLFEQRWDEASKELSPTMVTLDQVKSAIERVNETLAKGKLSSSNPANFIKDFIRRANSANKNWPIELTQLRWTAQQRTGGNNCFEFVRFTEDQTKPFDDPYVPSETTPRHRMQSITIPKASRDLGRKDEQWLLQVAVQQGVIPTHLALHSHYQVDEIAHLQSSLKLRKTEIDALFLARMVFEGESRSALITCEAKHGESILVDQIVNQANAALDTKKSDMVIPMAIKVVPPFDTTVKKTGNLVYVCEFEACFQGAPFEREHLKLASECLYEFHPPVRGI